MGTVHRPNAIEAVIHLYQDGTRKIGVTSPNPNLLLEIGNRMAIASYSSWPMTQRGILDWLFFTAGGLSVPKSHQRIMDESTVDQIIAVLERLNESLGCSHPSGSVIVHDDAGRYSPGMQLSNTCFNLMHSIRTDFIAQENNSNGVTAKTADACNMLASKLLLIDEDIQRIINLDSVGSIMDLEG